MSDEQRGQGLTPAGQTDAQVSRTGDAVTPLAGADSQDVERFSSGPRSQVVELTEERVSQVVRQSGNARNASFLAVLFIALFIPVYWFYEIGIPAVGAEGRLAAEADVQYVTDVSRGYSLYLANCARCHGDEGKGGIGPPLNDQAKLYNALTEERLPGTGHLNPKYLDAVLTVGGRYICGDPDSLMDAWKQPDGPLNYREVEEIIAWITAGNDIEFTYDPAAHGGTDTAHAEPYRVRGWRDISWQPAPGATPPPACWTRPESAPSGTTPAPADEPVAIAEPGTPEAPRVIGILATSSLQFTDANGAAIGQIPVKAGETVTFEIDNVAGFDHNFFIGTAAELEVAGATTPDGIDTWTEGVRTYTWTVPSGGELQFGCTVPGHYPLMHGDLVIVE